MDIISQFSVLVMLLIIALAFVLLMMNGDSAVGKALKDYIRRLFGKTGKKETPAGGNDGGRGKTDGGTVINFDSTKLYLEQLDMKSKKVTHRFAIEFIPPEGISVSRPDAKTGDILLDPACEEAYSVSERHLLIGEDSKGFFAVDNDSTNHTFVNHDPKPIDEISINDGLILFLGQQPIRFVFPKEPVKEWFDEAPYTQAFDQGTIRREKNNILRRSR